MAVKLRPPAGQPLNQGSLEQPNIAWMEFFQALGDFLSDQDGRFASIETGVGDAETRISALEASDTAQDAAIAGLTSDVAGLMTDVATLTTDLATLAARVTSIEARLLAAGIP